LLVVVLAVVPQSHNVLAGRTFSLTKALVSPILRLE
jgi:hypothetical protein